MEPPETKKRPAAALEGRQAGRFFTVRVPDHWMRPGQPGCCGQFESGYSFGALKSHSVRGMMRLFRNSR